MLEKGKEPEKLNMRFTTILWLVLCACSMSLMLWFSANKTVVIADGAVDREREVYMPAKERAIVLTEDGRLKKSFSILLPQDVKAGNIVMENHYTEGELWLYIKTDSEHFYDECSISGDVSIIQSGVCRQQKNGIVLRLNMAEMYEYRSTMEGDTLVIAYDSPHGVYDKIIILDPIGGEETGLTAEYTNTLYEKDVALQVAKQVQKKMSMAGVKVYLTRVDDSAVSQVRREDLIRAVEADMYIGIGVSADMESTERHGIGCYYNEAYYLPDFGNVELADLVAREVTIAAQNQAEGLIPAEKDSILQELTIPATELSMGYFSNELERELLGREAYQEKLAEGIASAITKACERLTEIEASRVEENKIQKK